MRISTALTVVISCLLIMPSCKEREAGLTTEKQAYAIPADEKSDSFKEVTYSRIGEQISQMFDEADNFEYSLPTRDRHKLSASNFDGKETAQPAISPRKSEVDASDIEYGSKCAIILLVLAVIMLSLAYSVAKLLDSVVLALLNLCRHICELFRKKTYLGAQCEQATHIDCMLPKGQTRIAYFSERAREAYPGAPDGEGENYRDFLAWTQWKIESEFPEDTEGKNLLKGWVQDGTILNLADYYVHSLYLRQMDATAAIRQEYFRPVEKKAATKADNRMSFDTDQIVPIDEAVFESVKEHDAVAVEEDEYLPEVFG